MVAGCKLPRAIPTLPQQTCLGWCLVPSDYDCESGLCNLRAHLGELFTIACTLQRRKCCQTIVAVAVTVVAFQYIFYIWYLYLPPLPPSRLHATHFARNLMSGNSAHTHESELCLQPLCAVSSCQLGCECGVCVWRVSVVCVCVQLLLCVWRISIAITQSYMYNENR